MTLPKHMGGLGFRDIELFNLALLAKQAWRLVQDPTSLSARILKAMYFPNGDFLDAELGASPSKICRSILDGRSVLKLGMIKRIGNREDTQIWGSNWIPRDSQLQPITCAMDAANQVPPQRVIDLIDQTSMSWDRELPHATFLPMDYELIKNIPLSTRRQTDFWAWHYEGKGIFTIESAYKLLVQTRENWTACLDGTASSSNFREEERSWTNPWKIKVPSKLKVFCGGWHGSRCLPRTCYIIETWLLIAHVLFAVTKIPGDIRCWSVTRQEVCGLLHRGRSMIMSQICRNRMLELG
jgi:hypothetical protein